MIKVDCTWGDGEDVLITLDNKRLMLYEQPMDFDKSTYGIIKKGSMFLTSEEAKSLAYDLLIAAHMADVLDKQCKEHDKQGEVAQKVEH